MKESFSDGLRGVLVNILSLLTFIGFTAVVFRIIYRMDFSDINLFIMCIWGIVATGMLRKT